MSKAKREARQRAKEKQQQEQANRVVKWIVAILILIAVGTILLTTTI